jgi:hypothetical protein
MSTYTPIATQTLGSAAASVTFSSIPQGYTDLIVVINGSTTADTSAFIRFNSDSGSNYSYTEMNGNGSSATSSRASNSTESFFGNPRTSYSFQANLSINNYSNSTTNKTFLSRSGNAGNWAFAVTGLWRNTTAITSVTFRADGTTWTSGSTFSIYGIQVGDKAQKAQGGNIVTSDGTYVYHTFTSSGSFTTDQALTVDYLVVAGGGGGGKGGGGGGSGGLRSTVTATGGGGSLESALSLSASKSYPVIVGAGGGGGTSTIGANGNDSVFSTITSIGGGYGGSANGSVHIGGNGGSGGGGSGSGGSKAGGTGTTNQGYAGGSAPDTAPNYGDGGGGGGGAVGANGTTTTGGNGGAGVAVSISGSSVTYAGGGGGGSSGGTAGTGQASGGNGTTNDTAATSASTNSGSGGGGGGYQSVGGNGGSGGSGVVIIRYAL